MHQPFVEVVGKPDPKLQRFHFLLKIHCCLLLNPSTLEHWMLMDTLQPIQLLLLLLVLP